MKTKYVSVVVALYVLLALALAADTALTSQSNTFSGDLTLRDFKDYSAVLGSGSYEESLVTAKVTVKLIVTTGKFTTQIVQAATGSGSNLFYFPSTCNRPPEGRQGTINGGTITVSTAISGAREANLDFDITGTQVSTRCVQGLPESSPSAYTGNVKKGSFFGTLNLTCGIVTSINFNRSTTDPDGRTHVTTGMLLPKSMDSLGTECGGTDVQVPRMDVVQVIQEADGSVPLIRGKATFVRAYLRYPEDSAGGKPLKVQLRGQLRSPVAPGVVTDLAVLQTYDRQPLGETNLKPPGAPSVEIVSFQLPNDWSSLDGLELSLEQISAPRIPIAQARPVFQTVPDLHLRIYAAEWTHEGRTLQASPAVVLDSVDLARSMLPVSNIVSEILPLKLDSSEVGDLASINDRLVAMRALDGLPTGSGPIDYALMFLPEDVPNPAGNTSGEAAGIPGDVASGFGSGGPLSPIVHELAHCLGRHHAVPAGAPIGPCPSAGLLGRFLATLFSLGDDNKSGVCDECAGSEAPDFPNYDTNSRTQDRFASIGRPNPDPLLLAGGLSTYREGRRDTPYYEVAEVMSYCSAPLGIRGLKWPSKFTYEGLLTGLRERASRGNPRSDQRARLSAGATNSASWLVRGRFDGPTNALRLLPVVTVPGGAPVGVVPGGPLHLIVLGANGLELARHTFTVSFGLEPGVTPGFLVCIPPVPGAQELRVVHQTTTLASRSISRHAPTVTVLSPNGGELLDQERATIRWVGSDADSEALTYTVQLSRDAGRTWATLDTDLKESTYDLPRHFLKGGTNHLIRVLANDGMLNGSDTSDAVFRVADSPPVAVIRLPGGGETFQPGDTIRFRGTGWDPESGVIGADTQFRWESDRDGLLLNGRASFDRAASELSAGTHQVRLTVIDPAGATNTTTVTVQIAGAASPRLTLLGYDRAEGVLQLQITPAGASPASLQGSEDLIRWTTLVSNLPAGVTRELRLTNAPATLFRGYRAVSP